MTTRTRTAERQRSACGTFVRVQPALTTVARPAKRHCDACGAFVRDQRGLSTLEYGVLFVLIIVGAIALWQKLGSGMSAQVETGRGTFSRVLGSANSASGAALGSATGLQGDPAALGSGVRPAPRLGASETATARPAVQSSSAPGTHASGAPAASATPSSGTSPSAAPGSGTSTSPQPTAAPPSSPAGTPPASPAERGVLERARDYVVNTPAAQYALGIGAGILQGYTPGGFLAPSPYASSKPFELGRGLGEMGAGIVETVTGLGMVGGGGALTGAGAVATFSPASPAGMGMVVVGVPTVAAGTIVVANGASATVSGYGTFIHAMSMADTPPAGGPSGAGSGSGSGNGSGTGPPGKPPAQPTAAESLRPEQLGKKLGEGGNKEVFAVGDNKAVGLLKAGKNPAELQNEVAALQKLEQLGLPTVNARPVSVGGRPGLLYDRYAQGSKDVVRLAGNKVRTVGSSPFLNQRSVADLRVIRQTLIDKQVRVKDLQFLIARDGHVVIADPLAVAVGTAPSSNNLRMINELIRAAGGK